MPPPEDLDGQWMGWVSASHIHNYVQQDPFVDWLEAYGRLNGFLPDKDRPGYDQRFDYVHALLKQAAAFEKAVVAWLATMAPIEVVATGPAHARSLAKSEETKAAMKDGVPIIAQAVLLNRDDRMDGIVDLLVRSDVLAGLCPEAFSGEPADAAGIPAPALGGGQFHYRTVDIKFTNLHRRRSGEVSDEHLAYRAQNWIYNEALGKAQGYTPPASYLLGRDLFRGIGRVGHADAELRRLAAAGAEWIRRLQRDGSSWRPLPSPTVPELRPNLRAWEDLGWHAAKLEIASAQRDLTLLPYVTPDRRDRAAAAGVTTWDDPCLSATTLGLGESPDGKRIDAVLAVNREPGPTMVPSTITSNVGNWRTAVGLECFVVLQAVSDQMDDFSRVPQRGGTQIVYMICWGWADKDGGWQVRQLVASDLTANAERELFQSWANELFRLANDRDIKVRDIRLVHWGSPEIPPGPWRDLDLLRDLVLEEPVAARGSFSFELTDMASALHGLGLVDSPMPSLPPGPLAPMAAAWWAAAEAKRLGTSLDQVDAIEAVGNYGRGLCRNMMEVLTLLRKRASVSLADAA